MPPAFSLAGLTSASVQWGAWAAIGMVATNVAVHRAMQRSGVGMLRPVQGLAAMQQLLDSQAAEPLLAAIPFAWDRFMRAPRSAAAFFYGEHLAAPAAPASDNAAWQGQGRQQQAVAPAAGAAAVPSREELLAQVLAAVVAVHGSAVDPQQPLLQAGLDSLGEGGGGAEWTCVVLRKHAC